MSHHPSTERFALPVVTAAFATAFSVALSLGAGAPSAHAASLGSMLGTLRASQEQAASDEGPSDADPDPSAGAAGGSPASASPATAADDARSIALNKSAFSVEAGQTRRLTAAGLEGSEGGAVVWASSDSTVATVDERGVVTAVAKGVATVTATPAGADGTSASCEVTVTNNLVMTTDVALLQSAHDYENATSDVWVYESPLAHGVWVAFDGRTAVEDGFDFIEVRGANERLAGRYTGAQLAGQAIYVEGPRVEIRLVADETNAAWGFAVTGVDPQIADGWYELDGAVYYYRGNAPVKGDVQIDGTWYRFDEGTGAYIGVRPAASTQTPAGTPSGATAEPQPSTPATPEPYAPAPSSFSMPYVIGMNQYEARAYLAELGLGVDTEWSYSYSAEPGVVIGQSVDSGATVNPGDGVILYVSAGYPTVDVPDVLSYHYTDAQQVLWDNGFGVDVVFGDPAPAPHLLNFVYAMDPYGTTTKGATVTLYVFSSPNG